MSQKIYEGILCVLVTLAFSAVMHFSLSDSALAQGESGLAPCNPGAACTVANCTVVCKRPCPAKCACIGASNVKVCQVT